LLFTAKLESVFLVHSNYDYHVIGKHFTGRRAYCVAAKNPCSSYAS